MAGNDLIKVLVIGALGKMGSEFCQTVNQSKSMILKGVVDITGGGKSIFGVEIRETVQEVLKKDGPFDVAVDLTNPVALMESAPLIVKAGIKLIVGTSGCDGPRLKKLKKLSEREGALVWVVPNFAIGAVLMMKFAEMAARYMPHVEIVEYHHDKKMDFPSGTAIATAERLIKANPKLKMNSPDKVAHLEGGRGAALGPIKIHAVRLPGFVATQEVIFGGEGQLLKLRHETIDRTSFMPGISLCVEKSLNLEGFHLGLETAFD